MFCICKKSPAETLLKAATLAKIHTQYIVSKGVADMYAVDVMCHNNYLNRYIKKFQYHVDALMAFEVDDDRTLLEDRFKELISDVKIWTCFIRCHRFDE